MTARLAVRTRVSAAVAALIAAGTFLTAPGVASAGTESCNWAHNTGDHRTCASSLTLHSSDGDHTLGFNTLFTIDHFADSDNHAWGTGNGYYGWVFNGYFQ